MKKLFSVLSVLLVFGGLAACNMRKGFEANPDLVTVSGVLVEQLPKDKESGTHFLVSDDSNKTAVRSLTINLSGDEYLSNKIQATGIMNQSDAVFEITGISVLEILSKDTKKLKQLEFKDTDLGFKLSYFDNWKPESSDDGVTFTEIVEEGGSPAKIVFKLSPFEYEALALEDGTTPTALETYYQQKYEEKLDGKMLKKVGVDHMDAIELPGVDYVTYVLYRSGFVYEITFSTGIDATGEEDGKIFDSMMADFQFISLDTEQSDNTAEAGQLADGSDLPRVEMDMTTFESLPYDFSGKYPAKWYYAGTKSSQKGILHHYGFSDQVITDSNELISLDVFADPIPGGGNRVSFNSKNFDIFESGQSYTVYTTFDERNYRIKGSIEHKDLILYMASSIGPVDKD